MLEMSIGAGIAVGISVLSGCYTVIMAIKLLVPKNGIAMSEKYHKLDKEMAAISALVKQNAIYLKEMKEYWVAQFATLAKTVDKAHSRIDDVARRAS